MRIALLEMPLTAEEQILLTEQGKLTGVALPVQRHISDLLYDDQIDEAQKLLIEGAIPAQDAVLAKLEELYSYQQTAAKQARS